MYILITIEVLILVAVLIFVVSRNTAGIKKTLTPLAGLAFGLILAGLFVGSNRYIYAMDYWALA